MKDIEIELMKMASPQVSNQQSNCSTHACTSQATRSKISSPKQHFSTNVLISSKVQNPQNMLELLPNPPIYGKYSHRLGEYPGYLDHSQPPMWNDGAPQRLFRKRISPRNAGVGRVGQMDYTWDDRVMSDGQFERNPQVTLFISKS